jgi:hypothetical protein
MTEGDWRETGNGNWVLPGLEGVEATVYTTHDSMWGAIWNGALDGKPRRLKAKLDSAEEACRAIETAIEEGEQSLRWWPPDDHWQKSKKGGCYRKLNGGTVSVKQAKSKAWYAVNAVGGLVGIGDRPSWFATETEARSAVDALASGTGEWRWVTRS